MSTALLPLVSGTACDRAGKLIVMEPDPGPSRTSAAHLGAPHKNTRREAREMALRMLFQIDVGSQPLEEVVESSLDQSVLEGPNRDYAMDIVVGTWGHREEIDAHIRRLSVDWALERQAAVDRNILRMTSYEILFRLDTPVAAVINEAVELAKKYSTAESGRFVNGVLGALARSVPRGDELLLDESDPNEPAGA
jgi:N utilization substance protein B